MPDDENAPKPVDASLVEALQAAVARDPDDLAPRRYLATLLLRGGDARAALEHAAFVLARIPDDIEVLRIATASAEAIGDGPRASGYRRVLAALGGVETTDPRTPPGQGMDASTGDGDARDEPDVDRAFRRLVNEEFGGSSDPVGTTKDYVREDWEVERPKLALADVAGMDHVKRRLELAFLGPLRNPEMMKAYGKSLRGGLMLYGPPGCGKTFIARATAGEMGSRFVAVGLSDVLDMWLGESERKLHETFELARRNAPCVLFFDEIDALGQKRSNVRHAGALRNVIAQLLAELDGIQGENEGVFILGATNHPWDVDTALRRPGRFDRIALVLPPDRAARAAILRFHLQGRPAGGVDVERIAAATEEFSGADLAHLSESAAELAMEDSMASGSVRPITTADLVRALKEIRPSTRPWFEVARNYAMFANEGGMYDDLLAYIKRLRI